MKTRIVLLAFLLSAFISCYGQYEPATPKDTVEGFYTEGEIRRFLLTQEKGSPIWKFARQSRTSNTVGVTLLSVGSVFALAGIVGYASSEEPFDKSIIMPWAVGFAGFGAINMGLGIWQINRSGKKLHKAVELYKYR